MGLPTDPVVYQIYPRSFQDSDGDGIGDLQGITQRLDHLRYLGVDALWLSPIYRSPMADFGYDVSDYRVIAPVFGTLDDFDALVAEAHSRGIAVLVDMILQHTSIEHRWFREHPEYYFWAEQPANNWVSVFGGSMWAADPLTGRYYMHRFLPEQADLNWWNPAVRQEMYDVMRFWADRGVDGFRLDAVDGLYRRADLADAPASAEPYVLASDHDDWRMQDHTGFDSHVPETFEELRRIREAFPDKWFVTEAYRPVNQLAPYAEHLDCAFNFEFLQAPFEAERIGSLIAEAAGIDVAWTLSNHDFSRLVTSAGRDLAQVAATLVLTLPGPAFIYQGDEIGMIDGPGRGGDQFWDPEGRDPYRHPMQWTPAGGFTTGAPWLPMTDPAECNVEDQRGQEGSMLELYRSLISLRRSLFGAAEVLDAQGDLLAYRRGETTVVCNFGGRDIDYPTGDVILATAGSKAGKIPPRSAVISRPR